ncbi:MAG: hypothetical protein RL094_22 [Candidatus Parcubacteria bacterium]|jgi:hypothetical protein
MDILEKIFGGAARVKLMRLFLFNPNSSFTADEVSTRTKTEISRVRRELNFLVKVGLAKKRSSANKGVWYLNERFPYLAEFQRLLLQTSLITPQTILKKLSKIGRLKLVVLSGLFKEQWDSRLDMLVVVDNSKKSTIESVMSTIEAEVGREIHYAVLDANDFKYRLGVGDRLVRDVLDYPHEVALNKLAVL